MIVQQDNDSRPNPPPRITQVLRTCASVCTTFNNSTKWREGPYWAPSSPTCSRTPWQTTQGQGGWSASYRRELVRFVSCFVRVGLARVMCHAVAAVCHHRSYYATCQGAAASRWRRQQCVAVFDQRGENDSAYVKSNLGDQLNLTCCCAGFSGNLWPRVSYVPPKLLVEGVCVQAFCPLAESFRKRLLHR